MATWSVRIELSRIRRELEVFTLTERLWPLEPGDAEQQQVLRCRERALETWLLPHA